MNLVSDLDAMVRSINYNLLDKLEELLESIDLEGAGIYLLNDESGRTIEDLEKFIFILNFIENETDIPTQVSDDTYDRIIALYKDMGGTKEIGVQGISVNDGKIFRQHKYPELRGSIGKIHFLKNSEVPEKDSRKSLEYFISGVLRELPTEELRNRPVKILPNFKWDGVSHVFEMKKGATIDHVLTRYDVDRNIGVDITHIFRNQNMDELYFSALPKNIKQVKEFGLKVETFMPTQFFKEYVESMEDMKCNRRSAVTSIVNQKPDQFEPLLLSFLQVQPLQIASEEYIDVSDEPNWYYSGKLNGRHQYIHIYTPNLMFTVDSLQDLLYHMDKYPVKESIDAIGTIAGDLIPIDGAVLTILDLDIIEALGRTQNKNKFQIAFKFPQGVKRTILKDVQFPVGPTASTITPLAIVEPVVINGNTITNATLSNFDKLERLDLNIGDEVIIKYDIIPKLEKDASCKKGTGRKIERPTECPICHHDLRGGARCINPNCEAKLSGKIYNYVKKMKIKNIGKKTIEKFVDKGFLTQIGDLYRLAGHSKEISEMAGFGSTSFTNIMSGIFSKTKVYPHEFLGAIGIPDVSMQTMKKVCMSLDIIHMSENELRSSLMKLIEIRGIGDITAHKIITGICERMDIIDDVIGIMEFLPYPTVEVPPAEIVLFTECRDYPFAEYLEGQNIRVSNGFNKQITHLIVPDDMDISSSKNAKVKKSKELGIQIVSLSKAKIKFGYSDV